MWTNDNMLVLPLSASMPRVSSVKKIEGVDLDQPVRLTPPTDTSLDNRTAVIAARDEDGKIISRLANEDEQVELKAKRKAPNKAKQMIQAVKQVFIPEE